MSHSHIDVRYVANLARLELSDEAVAEFQPQLEAILGYVEVLAEVSFEEIPGDINSTPSYGRLRGDSPHQSLTQEEATKNAPDKSNGMMRVPKIVADA